MSKHGQDYNEQFTSKEMFEQGRQYEREEKLRVNKIDLTWGAHIIAVIIGLVSLPFNVIACISAFSFLLAKWSRDTFIETLNDK